MIFRYISQLSIVVAFGLFHAIVDKQGYAKVDIAITYSLFIGGFFIEVWSIILNSTKSPLTWMMLKRRKWERLAKLSWFIFSSDIGWPEEKQFFTKSMGQYVLSSCVSGSGRARTFNQQVMTMIKWWLQGCSLSCVREEEEGKASSLASPSYGVCGWNEG